MKKVALNMQDIRTAVKTIKTAILKSRYMAARKANVEHLKLYFRVGAYVSANSRNGTWGTGAIAAISEKLSLELPGLRGFSPTNMKNMRIFFVYLVPQNVRRALAQAVKVKDVFGNETGQHYIVLSISYANTQETEKVFFKFDQIGIAYYDRSFPMMGLRVYESFFSPLTFSNIFSFKPESFGKVKVTRKSNVSVAGTMELSLPADSVKDMKKVFIYPLIWDRDLSTYWTPESRDKAEQACDRIESKYWNSSK